MSSESYVLRQPFSSFLPFCKVIGFSEKHVITSGRAREKERERDYQRNADESVSIVPRINPVRK